MLFKKEAVYSAGTFLEAIKRNSALPRHYTVTREARPPSPKIVAQEEREIFVRYVLCVVVLIVACCVPPKFV